MGSFWFFSRVAFYQDVERMTAWGTWQMTGSQVGMCVPFFVGGMDGKSQK